MVAGSKQFIRVLSDADFAWRFQSGLKAICGTFLASTQRAATSSAPVDAPRYCIGLTPVMSVTRAARPQPDGTSAIWLNIFTLIAVLWSTTGSVVMTGCQFQLLLWKARSTNFPQSA